MRELSLNVMDVVQNSITAEADFIKITMSEDRNSKLLSIEIEDNGKGMSNEQVSAVTDPFYTTRTTRKIGLGVPLFKMAAEMTGGNFSIESEQNAGTKTTAVFKTDSIDFTPVGDMCSTIMLLISCNPDIDFLYTHIVNERSFYLDTRELRENLDGIPLNNPDVVNFIREFLNEHTVEINK